MQKYCGITWFDIDKGRQLICTEIYFHTKEDAKAQEKAEKKANEKDEEESEKSDDEEDQHFPSNHNMTTC